MNEFEAIKLVANTLGISSSEVLARHMKIVENEAHTLELISIAEYALLIRNCKLN